MLGGVWDQELLDALYAGTLTYWHGHSVGGTNPSLLRALGAAAPVVAYDVNFNHEVAGVAGLYWTSLDDVRRIIAEIETNPDRTRLRGADGQPPWPSVMTGIWSPTTTTGWPLGLWSAIEVTDPLAARHPFVRRDDDLAGLDFRAVALAALLAILGESLREPVTT
jgi:hypothetical protein